MFQEAEKKIKELEARIQRLEEIILDTFVLDKRIRKLEETVSTPKPRKRQKIDRAVQMDSEVTDYSLYSI